MCIRMQKDRMHSKDPVIHVSAWWIVQNSIACTHKKVSDSSSVEVRHYYYHYTEKGEEILCPVTGEW